MKTPGQPTEIPTASAQHAIANIALNLRLDVSGVVAPPFGFGGEV
jgi:hypothetical protein